MVAEFDEKERATRTRQLQWWAKQFSRLWLAEITANAVSKGRGACAAETFTRCKPHEQFDAHWYAALEASGIKNFRFHDLRHTTASMLAAQGASLFEIADVFGHKTLGIVKRYSRRWSSTKRR